MGISYWWTSFALIEPRTIDRVINAELVEMNGDDFHINEAINYLQNKYYIPAISVIILNFIKLNEEQVKRYRGEF